MRQSDFLKTGGSAWRSHSAVVSVFTKFITCKHDDDEYMWSKERVDTGRWVEVVLLTDKM